MTSRRARVVVLLVILGAAAVLVYAYRATWLPEGLRDGLPFRARPGVTELPVPQASENEIVAASQGNNDFGIELYRKLAAKAEEENLFFSPMSVRTALAVASAGARGETALEMKRGLRLMLEGDRNHAATGALIGSLAKKASESACDLTIASSIWKQRGFSWAGAFEGLARESYGAGLADADFTTGAGRAEAVKEINAWVSGATRGWIKEIVGPADLEDLTRVVLANAVFFHAEWHQKFDRSDTRDDEFKLAGGGKVPVKMMYQKAGLQYAGFDDFQVLLLPYRGGDLAMVIILPRKIDGLPEIEGGLTRETLRERMAKLSAEDDVEVYLPRFRMEWKGRLEEALGSMGMAKAFGEAADFTGVLSPPPPEGLWIDRVLHRAVVEVDEEGTTAAAATVVEMLLEDAGNPVFRCDHPFLFLIMNREPGSILFMGRVMNPVEGVDVPH